ncbi:uncharacterized protein EKO05_0007754 [Ascochyta rabiei]|uniref:Uncharacterized protein n=1 Tax=Didymella rabiei TaxID=5454 RepID=A0A163F728_DIDRA|nr:uncharacterized protein EKO05_0007754 [Ascochyta rabiei]KZM24184.1 hypothetical protein ST47_g4648 [Ascochyta rabiei]UPX17395.1 hypothetical protein EKO05_0007754 [Ascochyta rabiei]
METISNIVNTATSTVSNVIYGAPSDETTKHNETAGKEPVSGQIGKGTANEPYDQGNSESALDKNTTSTTSAGIEPSREVEPTGSIQKPEDLIKAYNNEASDATTTTTTTGSGSTATGITDKAGVTDKLWKSTDVDAIKPSVADPASAPETGVGLHGSTDSSATGKDTLWRGVGAYKDASSTGTTSTGPTSTGSTLTGSEPTRLTSGESTSGGPKGAVDAEPKAYSIGDLTSGKETPPKSANDDTTSSANPTSHTASKTDDSAVSPPDLSTTSPGSKPDYSADTHQPSHSTGLAGERAGHGGSESTQPAAAAPAKHSSSISPSGDDDEKSGKLSGLKDKLKTKLHIGSKDH